MMNKNDKINESLVLKNQLDLAALVRQERHRAGPKGGKIPAQVLADLAGISRDTVFRMERGEDVSFSTVMAVLRVFGMGLHARVIHWPTLTEADSYFRAHTE